MIHGAAWSVAGPVPPADFDDLQTDPGCVITQTEQRAMSLDQLARVGRHFKLRLRLQPWLVSRYVHGEWSKNELTDPTQVVLYDVNEHVILPSTQQRQCSLVELMACSPQPPDYFVSHVSIEPRTHFSDQSMLRRWHAHLCVVTVLGLGNAASPCVSLYTL